MFRKFPFLTLLILAVFGLIACNTAPEPTAVPPTAAPAIEPAPEQRPTPTTSSAAQESETAETTAESYPAPATESQTVVESYPAPELAADVPATDSYPAPVADSASAPRTFTIDAEQSSASYIVAETFLENAASQLNIPSGLVDTIGTTQVMEGEFVLDLSQENPITSSSFQVDISTLSSGQNMRDNRIKRDWLESGTYPLATFVATAVENFPANYVEGTEATFLLLGDLTIRDITIPATFEVTATLADGTITGTAVAPLTMTDFGFEPPAMLGLFTVADDFRVEITFTATE